MATPSYSHVIDQINTFIVANGNNEITANVLNPILELITDFANNHIGDLDNLTTDETDTLVDAINSLKQNINDIVGNSVQLHIGNANPNDVPPSTYNYGDFFMQLSPLDNEPIQLWQFNGFEWFAPDAVTSWGDIEGNIADQTDLQGALNLKADVTDLEDYQLFSEKGEPNGYTPLDSGAKVPIEFLPDSVVTVESEKNIFPIFDIILPNSIGTVYTNPVSGRGVREIGNIIKGADNFYYQTFTDAQVPDTGTDNHVRLIKSSDLITWTDEGIIASNSEDPYIVYNSGTYYLYVEDKLPVPFRNIKLYTSVDLVVWTDQGVVLDYNDASWENEDVSSPTIYIEGSTWYMFYEGRGTGQSGAIGVATSTDGINWTKNPSNPIFTGTNLYGDLPWAEYLVPDDIIKIGNIYYLTGHARVSSLNKWLGFVLVSNDLLNWTDHLGSWFTRHNTWTDEDGFGTMLYNSKEFGLVASFVNEGVGEPWDSLIYGSFGVKTDTDYKDKSLIASSFIKNNGTSAQFLKADGSVDSAVYLPSSSYTAADVLTKIKTVDGSGSGLDADLLRGVHWGNVNTDIITDSKINIQSPISYGASSNKELVIGGTDNGFVDDGNTSHYRLQTSGNSSGQRLKIQRFLRSVGYTDTIDVLSNGNVGVGTTSPTYKLDVSGTGRFTGTAIAAPATLSTELVTKGQLDAAARPYKVYTALLTQTGTSAPTAIVLENTLGGTLVWSRNSTGQYYGTLSGAFPANKVAILATSGSIHDSFKLSGGRVNDNIVVIISNNSSGAQSDSGISGATVEIRVYP